MPMHIGGRFAFLCQQQIYVDERKADMINLIYRLCLNLIHVAWVS